MCFIRFYDNKIYHTQVHNIRSNGYTSHLKINSILISHANIKLVGKMPRASNKLALWIESSLSENADILLVTIKLNNMIYIMDF